jgi:hypothetical protein
MMLFLGAGGPLDSLEQHCDEGKGPKSSRMTRSSPKPSEAFRTVERSEVRFAENGLSFQKQLEWANLINSAAKMTVWELDHFGCRHAAAQGLQDVSNRGVV